MSNIPTTTARDPVSIWYSPPKPKKTQKQNQELKRQPLQQRPSNKRPRPVDQDDLHSSKPNKASKRMSELETLSDLVERTETAIYSRTQVKKMPRKKLENAYFSLQNTSTQVFLPAQKQKLANQQHVSSEGSEAEKVPDVVMGICNNYIEITAELMKMMEKTEEEKQHLQKLLDEERRQKDMYMMEFQDVVGRMRTAEDERNDLRRRLDAVEAADGSIGGELEARDDS